MVITLGAGDIFKVGERLLETMERGVSNEACKQTSSKPSCGAKSFDVRLRPLKRGIQAFFIGLAVVGAGLGVYEYREHLSVDDGLILEVVEISGQYRASEEEILMYSGLKRGTPLLDVDLEKVARAVRAHPWVKHVTVRRQLVDKVTIKVWEHQPAYLASIDVLSCF